MSFTRDDDDMLDHAKWRRALREGGDGVLLLWWRLRAWCARRLTDGTVPADMIEDVGCVVGKVRQRALQALADAKLIAWCEPGEDTLSLRRGIAEPSPRPRRSSDELVIVGYLQRNPSRAQVEASRAAGIERKQKHRDRAVASREAARPANDAPRDASTTQSQSQSQSQSQEREGARTPEPLEPLEPPEVPGLTVVAGPPPTNPGPLQPSKREQARDAGIGPPGLRYRFRPDWDPSPAHRERGREYGLTDEAMLQRAEDCRNKPIKHGFYDEDEHFFRELGWMKADRETRVFKTRGEREAFEMPGRDRRPA